MDSATDKLNVAGTEEDSITNGPGLRYVLFVQGCPRRCPGCHNPQTHEFGVGTDVTVEEMYRKICSNPLTRGVTFSGGEPFGQALALAELGRRLKGAGKELAVYTGYTFEELLASGDAGVRALLETVDVLVDGDYREGERSMDLHFRGSLNQRILNVPLSLARGSAEPERSERWHYEG